MRNSAIVLRKAYVPMIKFVGGRHSSLPDGSTGPHPCSENGLVPGSAGCVSVADFLAKLLPFKVEPYVQKSGGASSTYKFKERPLDPEEVSSIKELPSKYHMRPIEEFEIECVNNGGIY